jgi:hypothetical protein
MPWSNLKLRNDREFGPFETQKISRRNPRPMLRRPCCWMDRGGNCDGFRRRGVATKFISDTLLFIPLVGVRSFVRFLRLLVLAVGITAKD